MTSPLHRAKIVQQSMSSGRFTFENTFVSRHKGGDAAIERSVTKAQKAADGVCRFRPLDLLNAVWRISLEDLHDVVPEIVNAFKRTEMLCFAMKIVQSPIAQLGGAVFWTDRAVDVLHGSITPASDLA